MKRNFFNTVHAKKIMEVLGILIIICFVALKLFYSAVPHEIIKPTNPYLTYPQAELTIKNANYTVALSQSLEQMTLGLSYVESMPKERGMMFILKNPQIPEFWMKDMNFDLDFVWVRNGKVVDVTPYVSSKPLDQLKITKPRTQVDSIIELNAGELEKNQIGIGDAVSVKYLP